MPHIVVYSQRQLSNQLMPTYRTSITSSDSELMNELGGKQLTLPNLGLGGPQRVNDNEFVFRGRPEALLDKLESKGYTIIAMAAVPQGPGCSEYSWTLRRTIEPA
jgi:hypothetical protein